MEKKKVVYDPARCKGCHYCLFNCPTKSITALGILNDKGYEQIQVNQETCIACGICYNVCPDFAMTVYRD